MGDIVKVKNLPFRLKKAHFCTLCSQYLGPTLFESIKIQLKRNAKGKFVGRATLRCKSNESANTVVNALSGKMVDGRPMKVTLGVLAKTSKQILDRKLSEVEPKDTKSARMSNGGMPRRIFRSQQSLDASEQKRLQLDVKARQQMSHHMLALSRLTKEEQDQRAAWKWELRKKIWDHLEANNIAAKPRPVHNRIPNFVGAEAAAANFSSLPEFLSSCCVKVNPDTPQKPVRMAVLSRNSEQTRQLLVPQPRLRTGFFSVIDPKFLPRGNKPVKDACSTRGVLKYGKPLGLNRSTFPKIDLVVVGSVAVTKAGARIGKGEGFAELEYGILRWLGVIDSSTKVVTTVHDDQVVPEDEILKSRLLKHDVPVDIIVTPTKVIRTKTSIPRPTGIYWDLLSPEKLGAIRVLRKLKARIERETGCVLPSGPHEILPPTAVRGAFGKSGSKMKAAKP